MHRNADFLLCHKRLELVVFEWARLLAGSLVDDIHTPLGSPLSQSMDHIWYPTAPT